MMSDRFLYCHFLRTDSSRIIRFASTLEVACVLEMISIVVEKDVLVEHIVVIVFEVHDPALEDAPALFLQL